MINKVLDIINDQLAGIQRGEKIFGIAASVLRMQGAVVERMPGVVKADGEIMYVGIDDVYSLMIYHKINSSTIRQLSNGIGDNYGDIRNVFSMSAIIYWDTSRLNLYSDQMLLMLQSRMPLGIRGIVDVKNINIVLTDANTNTHQVYQQEYESEEQLKPLPAHMHIMQLNYNIESTTNPECYRQCPVCDPQ